MGTPVLNIGGFGDTLGFVAAIVLEGSMATDAPPVTDKQIAADALGRMPEVATLAEISERFAILAGLSRGQRDIDEGRIVTQVEAKRTSGA